MQPPDIGQQRFRTGVNYWPRRKAMYWWSDFDPSEVADEFDVIAALGMVALVTFWWVRGGYQRALAFTPVESHFLFPAPVKRRQLIHFKLLRAQSLILVNTLLWVGLLGHGRTELNSGLRAIALWTLFSTLHLHRLDLPRMYLFIELLEQGPAKSEVRVY